MDFLSALDADYRRFTAATKQAGPAVKVPTCPEWTVDDLVSHLGHVYLHKAECMRLNADPEPWPPNLGDETAPDLLRRAYSELNDEFASRAPESPAKTWFSPDQTVGFWIRRMAQETVIHRIDAELAAGIDSLPIAEDLALDGIDEILRIFLVWGANEWPDYYGDPLSTTDGVVQVGDFLVTWKDSRMAVEKAPDGIQAQATVTGSPDALLRWLWRRAGDETVDITGDRAKVAQFSELLRVSTQ